MSLTAHERHLGFTRYQTLSGVYFGTGIVSFIATCLVFVVYWTSRKAKTEQASKIIFVITVWDTLLTSKFFLSALFWKIGFHNPHFSFHIISDSCITEVLYGSFTSMASQTWNFCWVLNFMLVLSNPLRRRKHNFVYFWIFSMVMAGAATLYSFVEGTFYNVDPYRCWYSEDGSAITPVDVPLLVYLCAAVLSLAYACYRLWPGFKTPNQNARLGLFGRHAAYVVAFVIIWFWPVCRRLWRTNNRTVEEVLVILDAVLITGQAAVFAFIRLLEPSARRHLKRAFMRCLCMRVKKGRARGRGGGGHRRGESSSAALLGNHSYGTATDPPSPSIPVRPSIEQQRAAILSHDSRFTLSASDGADSPAMRADSMDPSHIWSPRMRRELFDVAIDLRAELAVLMLSAVCSVLLEPERWSDGDASSVTIQQSYSHATEEGMRKNVSHNSLAGDDEAVAAVLPSRLFCEYARKEFNGGAGVSYRLALEEETTGTSSTRSLRMPSLDISSRSLRASAEKIVSSIPVQSFKVTVYQPNSFRALRQAHGISEEKAAAALSPNAFKAGRLTASFSDGASSSFFCRSSCGEFVLKTMSKTELKTLLEMLPGYMLHLSQHPESLLCRFLGCFAVHVPHGGTHYLLMMSNVMAVQVKLTELYDMKFSTVGRSVPDAVVRRFTTRNKTPVLKDGEFWERYPDGLRLDARLCTQVLTQLDHDTRFLASLGIMDYSLLVGVKRVTSNEDAGKLVSFAQAAMETPVMDMPSHKHSQSMPVSRLAQVKVDIAKPRSVGASGSWHGPQAEMVTRTSSRELTEPPARVASLAAEQQQQDTFDFINTGAGYQLADDDSGSGLQGGPLEDGYASEDLPDETEVDDVMAGLAKTERHVSLPAMSRWSTISAFAMSKGTHADSVFSDDVASMSLGRLDRSQLEGIDDAKESEVGLIQVGLVDVLQKYDFSKKLEHRFKSMRRGHFTSSDEDISAVNVETYYNRFNQGVVNLFKCR